mgnify:FL=1
MVASVGYAMVINMMATKETWPFFILGFVLAAIPQLTLIALGLIGISLASSTLALRIWPSRVAAWAAAPVTRSATF